MPTYKQDLKATTGNAPTKYIDPLTGQEVLEPGLTYAPPTPSNEMGVAKPVFNPGTVAAGNQIFGDVEQRQRSLQNQSGVVQSPVFYKKKGC